MKIPASNLVAMLYDYLRGGEENKITGEMCFRVHFSQGAIAQVQVERKENVSLIKNGQKNP